MQLKYTFPGKVFSLNYHNKLFEACVNPGGILMGTVCNDM